MANKKSKAKSQNGELSVKKENTIKAKREKKKKALAVVSLVAMGAMLVTTVLGSLMSIWH